MRFEVGSFRPARPDVDDGARYRAGALRIDEFALPGEFRHPGNPVTASRPVIVTIGKLLEGSDFKIANRAGIGGPVTPERQ